MSRTKKIYINQLHIILVGLMALLLPSSVSQAVKTELITWNGYIGRCEECTFLSPWVTLSKSWPCTTQKIEKGTIYNLKMSSVPYDLTDTRVKDEENQAVKKIDAEIEIYKRTIPSMEQLLWLRSRLPHEDVINKFIQAVQEGKTEYFTVGIWMDDCSTNTNIKSATITAPNGAQYPFHLVKDRHFSGSIDKRYLTKDELVADFPYGNYRLTASFDDDSSQGWETTIDNYDGFPEYIDANITERQPLKVTWKTVASVGEYEILVSTYSPYYEELFETGNIYATHPSATTTPLGENYTKNIFYNISITAEKDITEEEFRTEFGSVKVKEFHPHMFTLTFDDGPILNKTKQIVDALKNFKVNGEPVRAGFFMVGDNDPDYHARYEKHPDKGSVNKNSDIVRYVAQNGHLIGNHTQHHASFQDCSDCPDSYNFEKAKVQGEILRCNDEIAHVIGKTPLKIFRPPYVEDDRAIRDGARELGFQIVYGNSVGDTWWPQWFWVSVESLKKRAALQIRNWNKEGPCVLFFHDIIPITSDHIGEIIRYLLDQGFTLVHFDPSQISEEKPKQALVGAAYCPIDLKITDPDGLVLTKQGNQIPGAIYEETDIDEDGDLDDAFIILEPKTGDYSIQIIPEPDALSGDSYSLEVGVGEKVITLAEDIPINEILQQPYLVRIEPVYPDISIFPTSHNFGNIAVGSTKIQTFTVTNTGNADLIIGSLSITGTDAAEFSVQNDNCSGQTLAPQGTLTVEIKFSPISTGAKSATLNIPSNDPDENPLSVSLINTEAASTGGKSGGGGGCFIDTAWSFVKKEGWR